MEPRLLVHAVLAQTASDAAQSGALSLGVAGLFGGRARRGGHRLDVLAEEASMASRGAVYPQVARVGPLAEGGVADVKKATGIAEGEPISLP